MKFGLFRLFRFSFGTLMLLAVAVGGLGGLNLYTYQRFTEESPVATLTFGDAGPRTFQMTLLPHAGVVQSFVLSGDEWQLDARMVKWTDWLTFLGESPLYHLDRISGRYISIDEARANAQTMHRPTEEQGIDVWAFARRAGFGGLEHTRPAVPGFLRQIPRHEHLVLQVHDASVRRPQPSRAP